MTREHVIVVAAAVMALAFVGEQLVARLGRRARDDRETVTNLAIGAGFLVCGAGWGLLTTPVYELVWTHTPLRFDLASPWTWVFLFFVRDALFYWSHRASHELPWMWASHHVHHSSPRLGFGTAMRNSWLGGAIDWLFMLPLAALGFDPLSIITIHMVASAYNFLAHSADVPRLGVLDRVLVTPANHRIHHSVRAEESRCNFGAVLTVWDRLFGTFRPVPIAPLVIGVEPAPARPYDPVYLELAPWADYLRGLRARLRRRPGPTGQADRPAR